MIKKLLKNIFHAVAPQRYATFKTARDNRYGQRFTEQFGVAAIADAIIARYGTKVLSGPFAGMNYITESAGSSLSPKLIGSYEWELAAVLKKTLANRYDSVIDVGSAEGFYAVGLAVYLPGSPKVYAFDANPDAQRLCRALAAANGVSDRIHLDGYCDPESLKALLTGRSLVICDVDGYEIDLFTPEIVLAFARTDLIIELHDMFNPAITPTLTERFAPSHNIEIIDTIERDPKDFPMIDFLEPEKQIIALSEFRNGPQQWAYMTPRSA